MSCGRIYREFNIKPDCCSSCHEDEGMGYEMCSVTLPNGEEVECCCGCVRAYKDKTREEEK